MDTIFSKNQVVLQNINYTSDYTELSAAIDSATWIHLLRQGVFSLFFIIFF